LNSFAVGRARKAFSDSVFGAVPTRMFTTNQGNDHAPSKLYQNSDEMMRSILTQTRTIAMLGASTKPDRDSYHVMEFLIEQCGYNVIPVNPAYKQQTILGQPVYATLSDVYQDQPDIKIDMVDVFRRSSEVKTIVDEILNVQNVAKNPIQSVWMQIGVVDHDSAIRAAEHGLKVAMDVCPMREIPRLGLPLPIHP
jgi:uncharacterized protein